MQKACQRSKRACWNTPAFASGWCRTWPARPGSTAKFDMAATWCTRSCRAGQRPAQQALQDRVGKLARPLDPEAPLWQMHLVDNCTGEDGKLRQALIIRIHHCIADGVALVGGVHVDVRQAADDADHPARTPRAAAAAPKKIRGSRSCCR